MILGIALFVGVVLVAAVAQLGYAASTRYPYRNFDAGPVLAPTPSTRVMSTEDSFNRLVQLIDRARHDPRAWERLLVELDDVGRALESRGGPIGPNTPWRRGRRFWIPVDGNGIPKKFDQDYLDLRITAIEQANVQPSRSPKGAS